MWRLWTRGWGPRDWWFWFRREGFPMWVACHAPKRIVYWCAILVATYEPKELSPEDFVKWESVPERKCIDGMKYWAEAHKLD